jgi:WS/DGAT/MGAT family acyltransferase
MLRVERPVQPNIGTGVMICGAPIELERLKQTLKTRLLRFDRFRQRVVHSRLPWGALYWEDDPDFDLNYHLQQMSLPAPGNPSALQALVSALSGTPLDMDRPLWQVHLVENYGSGCALIIRVHHSLSDGVALMHVLLSLGDKAPRDPSGPVDPCDPPAPEGPESQRHAAGSNRVTRRRTRNALRAAGQRTGLVRLAAAAATALYELLLSPFDSDPVLRGRPSEPKWAAWSAPIPLKKIKAIRCQMDGTVNDILLVALTGALRRYLQERGEAVASLRIRALVPVSLRPRGTEAELGNRIGMVLLPLPVDIADPLEGFRELKRRMDGLKGSLQAPMVYGAMQTFGRLPAWLVNRLADYCCSRATVEVSNVRGPGKPLYLAGAPLETVMFWIPRYGGIGLGVSIISYAGQVRVGVISDRELVPDPEAVIAYFYDELDALSALRSGDLASPPRETSPMQASSPAANDAQTTGDGIRRQTPDQEPAP